MDITIKIPDTAIQRIQNAFGHWDALKNKYIPATAAEVKAAMKDWLKTKVIEIESNQVATAKRKEITDEDWQ